MTVATPTGMAAPDIAAAVEHHARNGPSRRALITPTATLSYGELNEVVHDLAHRYRSACPAGVIVAVQMADGADRVATYLALVRAGIPYLPINTRLHNAEIAAILRHAQAVAVVHDDTTRASVTAVCADLGIAAWSWQEPSGGGRRPDLLAPPEVERIVYTSGTTGSPKGVVLTHENNRAHTAGLVERLGMHLDASYLVSLPLYHVSGLDTPGLGVFRLGAALVIPRSYRPADVADALDGEDVHGLLVGPQTGHGLSELGRGPWESVRWILHGMSDEASLQRIFPRAAICRSFGMTEATGIALCQVPGHPPGDPTCGVPLPGIRARVADTDSSEQIKTRADGELQLSGDAISTEYWRNPAATSERHRDGWLHTGDRMQWEAAGTLRFVGRLSDVIKSGGENVSATEVEECLLAHGSVLEAAVYPVPDRRWDEVPAAAVVLRVNATTTVDDLRRHCAEQLAKYKVPVTVTVLEALPRNVSGKVLKDELAAAWVAAPSPSQAPRNEVRDENW